MFKVLLPGLLRGRRVKPLDASSVVRVLVRVLAVRVVQQNFVLVRDTWSHVAYFTYDLLTISDKLSLIVARRPPDNMIHPLFLVFHELYFTLVKMMIFRLRLQLFLF